MYFQYDFQYVEKNSLFENERNWNNIDIGWYRHHTLVCFDSKRGDNSIHYTTPKWRDCNALCIDSITFYVKENDSFDEGMKHCSGWKNGFCVLGTVMKNEISKWLMLKLWLGSYGQWTTLKKLSPVGKICSLLHTDYSLCEMLFKYISMAESSKNMDGFPINSSTIRRQLWYTSKTFTIAILSKF